MNKKLVLIDGHSILHRTFYGIPDLTNSEGIHTNAIYGFLVILFKMMEEEQPDYLAVAFDVHAPTFRHEIYKEYKGTRKPMPEELRQQVPIMKDVLKSMGVLIMEKDGLEADDILGTMAKRAENEQVDVILVSGDRDLLQIASEHIKIRIPKTLAGRTEIEDYFAADVLQKYQVTPAQFIDLKGLMGDTADNIPGVPKVGAKTATDLMVTYGSIDSIYEHIEEITKKSIKESLIQNRDLAELSKILATIKIDCDIPFTLEQMKSASPYTKEAYVWFKTLEFKNFMGRFEHVSIEQNRQADNFKAVHDFAEADQIFCRACVADKVAFYVLEDGKKEEEFAGLVLAFSEHDIYVFQPEGFLTKSYLMEKLKELKDQTILITYDLKNQLDYLYADQTDNLFDVLIATFLLNPLKNDYHIDDIAKEHLGLMISDRSRLLDKLTLKKASEVKEAEFIEFAGFYAYVILMSYQILSEKLVETGMEQLFRTIEMPISLVLHEMEKEGVRVQRDELKKYGDALMERIGELEQSIYEQAGLVFNLNSPKQLGEILFEKLGLPGGKKTKTGYSTSVDVLEKLEPEYKIIAEILEYRGLAKLKSTYADGLATCIQEDGKIHTTYNQTIAATGRLSSTDPNLQNIPMRTELGRKIRKVFVPSEGCLFLDADYSQIELRILAHMSDDKQLIEAYHMDEDIHRITASKVFHTPFDEVTSLQRRNAKAVNFGIVYGISSFGLSQDLSISRKEAASYIEQYFQTYPSVKAFLDHTVEEAKEKGYVTTLFGRVRPIPELKSSNFMTRSFGERVAMNSPIQGTAADIMKIAMIRVWRELKNQGLKSRILLQVHDELLVEAAIEEVDKVSEIIRKEMSGAMQMSVALEIDLHKGENWYEAK